jgi:hypothetical protein
VRTAASSRITNRPIGVFGWTFSAPLKNAFGLHGGIFVKSVAVRR